MNRREFLKGGVASGVAVCGTTLNAVIAETDAGVRVPTDAWLSADVVVCGGGPAGVCAAAVRHVVGDDDGVQGKVRWF